MQCPYSGKDADDCSPLSGDEPETEEHIQWHLDRAVEAGELIRHEDGTYSVKGENGRR